MENKALKLFDPLYSHSLPGKRERLRALMRLRSQRQLLLAALATVSIAFAGFATFGTSDNDGSDVIRLGKGVASVETMPVSAFDTSSLPATPIPTPSESSMGTGEASYYGRGDGFAGRRTANGEVFDPANLTAAHRTLPMGSRVRVTNPGNGESVVVRINDRGPFHANRVIDLSYAAAREIGLIRRGRGNVRLALLT